MCGIFGILNKDGAPVAQQLVYNAIQKLSHRGPDGEGTHLADNVGLGHKRLSIIDLSEKGHQPFLKHNLSLVYNGEIYNFRQIRSELEAKGYTFHSNSDTEIISSSYDHWGTEMFSKFNGMWALAIYDQSKQELLLSRDRYGMKPLYIYENDTLFSFASEIKAFTALPGWNGDLNEDSIYDFLAMGKMYHNNQTFYRKVTMHEPAAYTIFDAHGKQIAKETYYSTHEAKLTSKNSPLTYQSHFSNAIKEHYVSDVEVACALSGGLDSSSIVAESIKQGKEVRTFTYAPSEEAYSELKYVDLLQDELGFENARISPDFQAHLASHRDAIRANEAPLLSMNFISSYLLYENVAKHKIKVLLAGQGADELLLGYNFYYTPFLRHLRKTRVSRFLSEVCSLLLKYPKKVIKAIGSSETQFATYLTFERSQNESPPIKGLQSFYNDQLSYGHLHGLLQFEDRVSMAHGVEGRLPFLDKDFSSYLHTIPFHQKIVGAIKKMPLRKAMKGLVPDGILGRKDKMGYLSPQEKWISQHPDVFLGKIREGAVNHAQWFSKDLITFVEENIHRKKHSAFIWRVYSFLEFLAAKL